MSVQKKDQDPEDIKKHSGEDLNVDQDDNKEEDDNPLDLIAPKEPVDSNGHGPYIPGSKTDLDKRHESYDVLVKNTVEQLHGPQEDPTDQFWRKVAEKATKDDKNQDKMKYNKKSGTLKLPYVNVTQNFQFAKKMHAGNLEHDPLPDTLGYRNMTKVGEHRDSDIVVKPYAIGWKGYGASGPTCCTKMRVHRPKTCDPKKNDGGADDHKQRPATSALDLGGEYKKPMSLMDLAICWDFKADDPKREPRPPKHIDGSNGSQAPAVFTVVNTPKEEVNETILTHAYPIFNQNRNLDDVGRHSVPHFEKDMTKEKRKESCDVQYCPQHNQTEKTIKSRSSSRKSSIQSGGKSQCDGVNGCGTLSDISQNLNRENSIPKMKHIKEAWNSEKSKNSKYDINRNRHSLESYEKTPLAQGKLQQSSPNESEISKHSPKESSKNSETTNTNTKHKHCFSCNGVKVSQERKQKDEYKFAFKAGNPNSVQSTTSNDSKELKIPKMRHPYTKKSYTIPTLAPPFSIWRDANATGYPEHWRLASVYQHAYKPPEQRRKPLIESVYQ
ncbi:uncharacterized protein LOC125068585 [Vanessa atalanta]|uniref:uncharacterized protein LOC125068585 n=1 Tax=Vanessa atalanta TaxID=42275 RepID=UPI001FCE24CD|nr:uncharacterized protein LOC125068585 [Vanessa atalanta]